MSHPASSSVRVLQKLYLASRIATSFVALFHPICTDLNNTIATAGGSHRIVQLINDRSKENGYRILSRL
jgi:hypothetical protein